MPVVDVLVGVVIAAALLAGVAAGLARAARVAGFAIGAVIGSRLPLVLGEELDSEYSLIWALPGALMLGAVVAALVERYGKRLARFAIRRERFDAWGGGGLAGGAAAVAVWLLAPVASEVRAVREPVEDSEVLTALNSVLEPAGPERPEELPPIDDLPRFAGRGLPPIEPADPNIVFDPDVVAAEQSVVRIHVTGCRGMGVGSGWIGADGIVVTNAHVVAGSRALAVQPRGVGPHLRAVAIWFDGDHDVALLRVAQLRGRRALPTVRNPRAGTDGAMLGFPLGRRAIRRARIGPTTSRLIGSLGGGPAPGVSGEITGRLVTTVRGRAQPGLSGGPTVDRRGRVLTTVFAGGGAGRTLGVPNRFVRAGLAKAGPRVSTGRCSDI